MLVRASSPTWRATRFWFRHLHPQEATDIGNLGSLGLQGRVADGLDRLLDLGAVERVGVELVVLPDVGAGIELDGGAAGSSRTTAVRCGEGTGGANHDSSGDLHFLYQVSRREPDVAKEVAQEVIFSMERGRGSFLYTAFLYEKTRDHIV